MLLDFTHFYLFNESVAQPEIWLGGAVSYFPLKSYLYSNIKRKSSKNLHSIQCLAVYAWGVQMPHCTPSGYATVLSVLKIANSEGHIPCVNITKIFTIFKFQWYIQATCATQGQGLYEGLDWLSNELAKSQKLEESRKKILFCPRNLLNFANVFLFEYFILFSTFSNFFMNSKPF